MINLKKLHKFGISLLIALCFSIVALAQEGIAQRGVVTGKVLDKETGEELIGVTVQVEGTSTGAATDISGTYQMQLMPGTYSLKVSYVSYATQTISDVVVKSNETTRINVALATDDIQLQEVVVSATQINNNEVALLSIQKKSLAVQDGISSEEMARIGAGNSAESMKSVTGATVEGGKYVVMRGLGDRYSLTQMNGVNLPSTDPYRNSASMDLIPTAMVDNIVTTKTFTPDQPGNFTGGNVNITTKSLPDQFYFNFGVSLGYNTQSSLKDDFLTDPINGKYDWLGFDDGSREMPEILQSAENQEILSNKSLYLDVRRFSEDITQERNIFHEASRGLASRPMAPTTKNTFFNTGYSLSFGDRKQFMGRDLGYNVGLSYSRNYIRFDDKVFSTYERLMSESAENLPVNISLEGQEASETAALGGIFSLAYKLSNFNELKFDATYSNDAETSVNSLEGIWPAAFSGSHIFQSRSIQFIQRQLANFQLSGKHSFGPEGVSVNWIGGYVSSSQYEPESRVFANAINSPNLYTFNSSEGELPFHFYRDLNDQQYNGKIDVEVPVGSNENKLKFGLSGSRKNRDFAEERYQLNIRPAGGTDSYLSFGKADGDFNSFFAPENSGILDTLANRYALGNSYIRMSLPTNFYTGYEQFLAVYGMGVVDLTKKLKFIGGLRVEKTDFEVKSERASEEPAVIDELDFLPSVNFVYALTESSNIRAAASQTIGRPNMRELAPFTSFDMFGGPIFIGNPELKRSLNRNFDLRFETYPRAGELLAISAFYKKFKDPIVQKLDPGASGGQQFSFVNVDQGFIYGIELELRKNLDFISETLRNFKFSTNFTYTVSKVDLTQEEFETFSKIDPDLKDWRPFQAQSPFIANVNLSYINEEQGFDAGVYANVFGRRLYANGFAGAPDVYEIYGREDSEIPVPDLNVMVGKTLGEHFKVTLRGDNLLNYRIIRNQEFKGEFFTNQAYNVGRTFVMSLKYSL